jgi:hypothetical protein
LAPLVVLVPILALVVGEVVILLLPTPLPLPPPPLLLLVVLVQVMTPELTQGVRALLQVTTKVVSPP